MPLARLRVAIETLRKRLRKSKKALVKLLKKSNKNLEKVLALRFLPKTPLFLRRCLVALLPSRGGIRKRFIKNLYHVDSVAASAAYHQFNAGGSDIEENYDRKLIERSVTFGYMGWARKIQPYVQSKSILDVGCGTGLHGIGYIVSGAKSYTGLDPKIKLDDDQDKNKNTNRKEHFGATPREIMQRMPRINLVPGTFEDIAPDEKFDLIVLHNVTEHLANIETVFEGIHERLNPGGKILYHHHNFYCWNGHHLPPRTTDQIIENDPAQSDVIDWSHLTFVPPEGHYISYGLNKIRLDEIKALTERLFEIEYWEEIMPKVREGLNRLTPEILARHPEYTERELNVKNVLCVAHHKVMKIGEKKKSAKTKTVKKPSSRERDMRRDEVFMPFFERCKPYTMTTMERLYGIDQAIEYLVNHNIEGDVVECGVWRGGSMMMAALSLMHLNQTNRDLYLFDTFEGMIEPTEEDYKFGEGPAHDKWRELRNEQGQGSNWNFASLEEVRETMMSTGYPPERLHFIPGMVEETLPAHAPDRISLLRLDTDFYTSTLHEYVHLYPRLTQRGVLIIDDYGTWAGSAQATEEYFEQNNIVMLLNRLDPGGRMGIKLEPAEWQL